MNPYALLDPAVALAHHVVLLVAAHLPWPGRGASIAVALALVVAGVRALLVPLAVRRFRHERVRAGLAPQVDTLRRRHTNDPHRLLAETNRLYRDAGTSATAGLLGSLLQLPLIATVYRLVVVPSVAGRPNLVLAAHLFGAPLAAHWPELVATGGLLGPAGAAMLGLIMALVLVATLSARQLPAQGPRFLRLLPYGTVVMAAVSPVAVGLYLLVSTAWSVAERAVLMRVFAV